jgi:hypothetical protein
MACQGYSRYGQREYQRKFLLPLAILFLLSLGCALLSYSSKGAALLPRIFFWPAAVIAALLGLLLAYCLLAEALTHRGLRKTWQQAEHFRYRLDVGVEGVLFSSAKASPKPEWFEISRYLETDNLFILCNETKRLVVPKRLFRGEAGKNEFLQVITCLITSNQVKNSLAVDP